MVIVVCVMVVCVEEEEDVFHEIHRKKKKKEKKGKTSSFGGVTDAVVVDGEDGLGLGKAGRVVDLADAGVLAALPEGKAGGGGVGHDVAADWLLRVGVEHGGAVHLGHHLVGDHHRHAELVCEAHQVAEKPREVHLASRELSTAAVVGPVERGGRVDDNQGVPGLGHHGGSLGEEGELVVGVVGAGEGDVVEDLLPIQAVLLRGGEESLRAKGTLGVNVHALALTAALLHRQLAGHGQGVTELRLARAELAKDLSDRPSLNTTYDGEKE